MDINALQAGRQYTLSDGSVVEVKSLQQDRVHVRVKYLDTLDNPELGVGDERDIPYEEFIGEFSGTHTEGLT